jgi:bifunctional non-homologous end joining protein LigD
MPTRKRGAAAPSEAQLEKYRRKRDFTRTAEPAGGRHHRQARRRGLQFVVQKHAATHLHFDLRLELDGVMKSWAVPRGPSADPQDKRLAMQVEDHPVEYNTFEGTIPKGEYGGGTVMLWDRGTYTADEAGPRADPEQVLRSAYRAGKLSITFQGERLQGSWALVRTDPGTKPKWLLIKHRDEHARRGGDLAAEYSTSVATGRTMSEIGADGDRVWRSNRGRSPGGEEPGAGPAPPASDVIRPMLPQPVRKLPGDGRMYEAWQGGERVLAYATAEVCALLDEKGRNRSNDFRELAQALARLAERESSAFVLDAEVTGKGESARLHVIDVLLLGSEGLLARPWRERRQALEELFTRRRVPGVRLAVTGSAAEAMLRRAGRERWAGIYARDPESSYRPGKRTADWVRLATPVRYR